MIAIETVDDLLGVVNDGTIDRISIVRTSLPSGIKITLYKTINQRLVIDDSYVLTENLSGTVGSVGLEMFNKTLTRICRHVNELSK